MAGIIEKEAGVGDRPVCQNPNQLAGCHQIIVFGALRCIDQSYAVQREASHHADVVDRHRTINRNRDLPAIFFEFPAV